MKLNKNMNIAFLSSIDPFDINNWSGTLYYITKILSKKNNIEWIGEDIINLFYSFRFSKKSYPEKYASLFGSIISEKTNRADYSVLIVRDYFFGAYLNVKVPIIYIGDTTFNLFKENLRITSTEFESVADSLEKKR